MIVGVLLFLIANAAVLLGAHELLRRVQTGEPSVDTVVFLLLRFLLISAAVIVAGVTATLSRWGLGVTAVVALSCLLACGAHRRLPRPAFPKADRWMKGFAGIVAIRLLLQVWFFAPHLGDALAYHLPKVAEWVQNGRFTREMGLHPHVTFPAGFELIETWWVVFLHHDVLIEMAGVEFLVLAFAATYALARRLGLASRWSFFAGLLYVMTPGLHLSATSCLNDTPVAALVVATFALVVWRAPLPVAILAVGLGAGVKATYIYALPGVVLLWAISRKETRLPSPATRLSAGLALVALLIGGFWSGRNLAWYGNPLYPIGSPGYAKEPVAVQTGPRLASFVANASDLINTRVYDNRGAYGANVDNIAGWGAPAFACGLLALMLAFLENATTRRITMGFLLSLASCFLLMIHDPWSLKYVFFFPAIIAVAVARISDICRPLFAVVAVGLAFSFFSTMLPYDLPAKDLALIARQTWRERSVRELTQPPLPMMVIMGIWGGYRTHAYLLYGPEMDHRVVYLQATSSADLLEVMRRERLQYVDIVPCGSLQENALEEARRRALLLHLGGSIYLRQSEE